MHDHVNVTTLSMIVIAAVVNDRCRRQTRATKQDSSRFDSSLSRLPIGSMSLWHMIYIAIEATYALIQIYKLLRGNEALIQRLQAILHTHVIERSLR